MAQIDRSEGLVGNTAIKAPVRAATTANITLSGEQTIDGVACVDGDRVLVKDQTTGTENGIYDVSSGAWERSDDFDGSHDIAEGTAVSVNQGTTNTNTSWRISTASPVVGSTLVFIQALTSDSSSMQFLQAGTGAVARTVQDKERDIVSVKDFGAVGDGVTDDTAAFAAATAASKQIFIPDGTYLIDIFDFTHTTSNDNGYVIQGASTTDTILKARTSSTTKLLKIEGSGVFTQYHSFKNFTLDMANMTNVSTSYGLYTKKTWGNCFEGIRIINNGASTRTYRSDTGVYTSTFLNCDFSSTTGIVELQGISLGDAVTTLTFIGCSHGKMIADSCVAITVSAPIVQGTLDKFVLSNVTGFTIYNGDIEGAGIYLTLGSNVNHLRSFANTFSDTTTYKTGTFNDGFLMDIFGATAFELQPISGTTHTGVVTEQSSDNVNIRKVIKNTNATPQQVDIEYQNVSGSAYIGMKSTGETVINAAISNAAVSLQQSGSTRIGVDTSQRLVLGTLTQNTVGAAGASSALPATPSGYARIVISGVDFVIPYYAQA